jgi:hypothetical protein
MPHLRSFQSIAKHRAKRHTECVGRRLAPAGRLHHTHTLEALIRTLSVSLVAVAAIAASLLLTREKEEAEDTSRLVPAGENTPARLKLDAIRAAGL